MTQTLTDTAAHHPTTRSDADSLYGMVKTLSGNPRFFAGSDQEALQQKATTIAWAAAENRLCGDSITLAVCAAPHSDEDAGPQSTTLCYAGYFCALCHAMAELLCLGHGSGLIRATCITKSTWYPAWAGAPESAKVLAGIESLRLGVASKPSRQRCTELPLVALERLGGKLARPDPEGKFTP